MPEPARLQKITQSTAYSSKRTANIILTAGYATFSPISYAVYTEYMRLYSADVFSRARTTQWRH